MGAWIKGWMKKWKIYCMDGWVDEWRMDGWMDELKIDGWMDE